MAHTLQKAGQLQVHNRNRQRAHRGGNALPPSGKRLPRDYPTGSIYCRPTELARRLLSGDRINFGKGR